jgi:hypothetical protein
MSIEIKDNFKFVRVGNSVYDLLVESEKIKETIEYIKKEKIKSIELNFYHGYLLKNIDFITEVADIIENISIVTDDINLNHIEEITNLKKIFIGGENKSPVDFSYFKYLENCNVSWHKDLKNLSSCKYLHHLYLRKYIYNNKTAHFIEGLSQLKSLCFIQSKFEDLEILKLFPNLEILEIYYNRWLVNIKALDNCKNTLTKLILDHCKNIDDYGVLEQLTKIKFLNITDSKPLINLKFIKNLENLEHFSFVGTNILDGNLSPCIGINYVGFFDNKNYTHRSADFVKS